MATHGLASTYRTGGCRCDPCRKANTDRVRAQRHSRATRQPPADSHGTASTYRNWMCRCEPCKAAHSQNLAERRTPQRRAR